MSDHSPDLDLDLTLLLEIADGSNEFIVESIDMFLQQTPPAIQDIGNALEHADWATAAGAAHKLKATLGFFGMLNSQALINEIESSCKNNAPNAIALLTNFNKVEALLNASTTALHKIKEETEAKF